MSRSDLFAVVMLGALILISVLIIGRQLLAVSIDPEHAHVQGIKINLQSAAVAALSAVTVTVGMRAVGLLLVSAIMIIPVVSAQQIAKSFKQTMVVAAIVGWISAVLGLTISFYVDVPPGSTIVLTALGIFALSSAVMYLLNLIKRKRVQHESA